MITPTNAITAYLRATEATPPQPQQPLGAGMSAAAHGFEQAMAAADQTAIGAMSGSADTNALVQSLTEAELALDAAVAIRDKVVEAYQEILRMPV
ncbi:flagellar hook-basal body complex protein FliE [Paracoccus sp. S1E-3]|uniref:flagellar hook-basal body complex protein FliE n=1 Tax=Paracoccus sp. S1E-3 TaxID=2756130 RepID=UPI0015EF0356|nr:flagellar hook-basal body complex protein FliE [Paracoccus sp. S1E-3]MBA4492231.1 flagellar hook-basal body complex protein FliE [Paracoccus sp. S1E-3]